MFQIDQPDDKPINLIKCLQTELYMGISPQPCQIIMLNYFLQ